MVRADDGSGKGGWEAGGETEALGELRGKQLALGAVEEVCFLRLLGGL